ncbi:hypothetical protein EFA69_17430 [Rufibacter immobilis]|uniref:Tail specific protease domain-containing protein n=1 Tax=Rufibacter immobilis TaxID=1348778 RepID=A0A3M9MRP6_9BACT|nr:S41 family peptidase [Rufibacter immobilis]RNI27875.1 hypothetical protein EFA69_17430 [Rufibacter immobilis]
MKIYGFCLSVFLFANSCTCDSTDNAALKPESKIKSIQIGDIPDSVANYINAALDSIQQHSIRKNHIDWTHLRTSTFHRAKGATTYQQTYPAIQEALRELGDNHSFFKTPLQHKKWHESKGKQPHKAESSIGMMLEGGFALVEVRSFSSGDQEQMLDYASRLQAKIKELDAQNPIGWIVNLSHNPGGNLWPMLAGIGPLVGEGVLGAFLTVDGACSPWMYEEGEVRVGEEVLLKVPNPYTIKDKQAPIALLVDERTASSGEAILVSFMGRPDTKSFGEPTAGLSTANKNFTLVDSAQLVLTSAVFTDRNGRIYGKKIVPDVDLSNKWYFLPGFKQSIMRSEAKDWLMKMKR